MKKMRLGSESGHISIIIISLFFCIIMAIEDIIYASKSKMVLQLFLCIISWCMFLLIIHCFEAFWCIEDDKNLLRIKNIFGTVCEYKKSEINICYVVKSSRYNSIITLRPCLMIGTFIPTNFCFENMFKYVYDNYFLLALNNKKKLMTILQMVGKEIEIPTEEELEFYCKQWYEMRNVSIDKDKVVKEYYALIEEYNETKRTNK